MHMPAGAGVEQDAAIGKPAMDESEKHPVAARLQLEYDAARASPGDGEAARRIELGDRRLHAVLGAESGRPATRRIGQFVIAPGEGEGRADSHFHVAGRQPFPAQVAFGEIGPDPLDRPWQEALASATNTTPADYVPATQYAVDWIVDQLPLFTKDTKESLVVETSLDTVLQLKAEASLRKRLADNGKKLNVSEGALVMLDATGGVKALVGGRSYKKSQFNRAVKAKRQPGSAFKTFVYLAAIEAGYRPETVEVDEPIRIGNWTPENYTQRYLGPVTLETAFALSINTVAARLGQAVTPAAIAAVAHRLGITRIASTDTIREVLRTTLAPGVVPELAGSSFDTRRHVPPEAGDVDPLLAGFFEQAETVSIGARGVVARAVREGLPLVLEGVHVVPGSGLVPPGSPSTVVEALLVCADEALHRSHFQYRAVETGDGRPVQRYLDRFAEIRRIQDALRSAATRAGTWYSATAGRRPGTGSMPLTPPLFS